MVFLLESRNKTLRYRQMYKPNIPFTPKRGGERCGEWMYYAALSTQNQLTTLQHTQPIQSVSIYLHDKVDNVVHTGGYLPPTYAQLFPSHWKRVRHVPAVTADRI